MKSRIKVSEVTKLLVAEKIAKDLNNLADNLSIEAIVDLALTCNEEIHSWEMDKIHKVQDRQFAWCKDEHTKRTVLYLMEITTE